MLPIAAGEGRATTKKAGTVKQLRIQRQRRFLRGMPALLVLVSALWVGPSAHAINPAQSTADGVVQILGYDAPVSIRSFWK